MHNWFLVCKLLFVMLCIVWIHGEMHWVKISNRCAPNVCNSANGPICIPFLYDGMVPCIFILGGGSFSPLLFGMLLCEDVN